MKKQNDPPNPDKTRSAPYYGDSMYSGEPAYGGESEEGIDLMRLLQVALRHWKTILGALLLGAGVGVLYLLFVTPIYSASTLMEMRVRKQRFVKATAVFEDRRDLDFDRVFNTRMAKFKSPEMKKRVVERYAETNPDGEGLNDFQKSSVRWIGHQKSFLLEVGVNSPDPLFAQHVANLYAECATQMMMEENRAASDHAVTWLLQQATHQKAAVFATEQALVDYRIETSLDVLRSQKHVSEETLIKLNTTLVELESKLIINRSLLKHLEETQKNAGSVETIPAGLVGSGQLQQLVEDWWKEKMKLSALKDRYTEKHPSVKESIAQMVQLRNRLDEYLATVSETIGSGVTLLESQVRDIRSRMDQENRRVLEMELKTVRAEGHLNTLTREKEAADTSYRSVLARIEESRMAADENTAVLKLVQMAGLPGAPVSPNKMRVIALFLLLGGLIGYGLAWGLELLEDKLTGIKDVERFDLDMLALIPKQTESNRPKLATLCLQDKFSHVSETFASLRTILSFKDVKDRYNVLLITSTQPEEGKTVIASNLAISMAQSGRKTLLIDLDMRRPRMRTIFAKGKKIVSLLHTLEENLTDSFDQLPLNGGHENLSVITGEPSKSISPAEIIGGEAVPALIAWARENYDCIIIDSPPLGVVGDSQCIANYVDGVILVARPEHTRKRALRHTVERMLAVNTNVIGVILNNVPIRRHFAYSSSYHHYGTYHAYGTYAPKGEEASD